MQAELHLASVSVGGRVGARLRRILPGLLMAASRGAAVGLQFLAQIAVGGLAGPAGLGVLQLFTSWSCILGEIMALGLPARAMRISAINWSRREVSGTAQELDRAAWLILKVAVCLAAGFALVMWLTAGSGHGPTASFTGLILVATLLAAPLFALSRVGAEALKGTDATLPAISLESLLAPLVILLVSAICWLLAYRLTNMALLLAGLAGFSVTALFLWWALQRRLKEVSKTDAVALPALAFRRDLAALWGTSVLSIGFLHLPFLVLPWYAGTDEVGIYAVAHKLVNIVTTLLILMAAVFGPAFARAAAEADRRELGVLLWRTQWISLAIFTPLVLVLLLASEPLAAVFSVPADTLRAFLLALTAGQLVNAATGLPGVLLNMSGAAELELRALLVSLALVTLAAPLVGESYGALGLAWLFSAALAFKNLASYLLAGFHLMRIGKQP